MTTPTYTLIDSTTLGSSASSVTFSGISGTGKGDLVLSAEFTTSDAADYVHYQINLDTGSNYPYVWMRADGSTPLSGYATAAFVFIGLGDTSVSTQAISQIADFSATDKHKSILTRANSNGDGRVRAEATRWANTAAITSLQINANSSTLQAGSTFFLYQLVSE